MFFFQRNSLEVCYRGALSPSWRLQPFRGIRRNESEEIRGNESSKVQGGKFDIQGVIRGVNLIMSDGSASRIHKSPCEQQMIRLKRSAHHS